MFKQHAIVPSSFLDFKQFVTTVSVLAYASQIGVYVKWRIWL